MNKFTHEVLYEKFKDFLKEKSVKEKIHVFIDIYEDEDFYEFCSNVMMNLLNMNDIKLLYQSLEIKHIDYSKYIFLSYTPLSDSEIEIRLMHKPEKELKEMKMILIKKEI